MVDPMDLEFDRFNGNIAPDVPNTSEEGKPDIPLDRPVDLDPEFDRYEAQSLCCIRFSLAESRSVQFHVRLR